MDTCGAKTRAGTPCKQKATYCNGRRKFHGGLATGPVTEAGKEQCRINGRKGGRPRKGAAEKTEVIEHQGSPKGSDAQVAARVPDSHAPVTSYVVTEPVERHMETEIMDTDKTIVSAPLHGAVSGRVAGSEMSSDDHVLAVPEQPEITSEKPKSWMLKEVMVLPRCERCEMFASNGACLAVAKGMIPSIPTDDTCAAFSDFEKT